MAYFYTLEVCVIINTHIFTKEVNIIIKSYSILYTRQRWTLLTLCAFIFKNLISRGTTEFPDVSTSHTERNKNNLLDL